MYWGSCGRNFITIRAVFVIKVNINIPRCCKFVNSRKNNGKLQMLWRHNTILGNYNNTERTLWRHNTFSRQCSVKTRKKPKSVTKKRYETPIYTPCGKADPGDHSRLLCSPPWNKYTIKCTHWVRMLKTNILKILLDIKQDSWYYVLAHLTSLK